MHVFFDHTGDIGVRIEAATREAIFAEAAVALTDVVTTADAVRPRDHIDVALEAGDLELLLVDWLSELLFRFETRNLLVSRADVTLTEGDGWRLNARVHGETLDAARHPVKVLLKAVTYHGLEVRQEGDRWRATVIFDI